MIDALRVEILASRHQRIDFSCGVAALDRYFHQLVTQDIRRRLSNCFVAIDPVGAIVGYYTFAAAGIPLTELPPELARRLPRYPSIPAALIGRLAVDRRFHGEGVGGLLVVDAISRAISAAPAIYALIVEAKDDRALGFYRHLGFQPFIGRPMTLFLPLAEAAQRLAGPAE